VKTHVHPQPPPEQVVYRQLAIPVSAFDHLKATQRGYEAITGQRLSLAQTVALVAREHKRLMSEGNPNINAAPGVGTNEQEARRIPAILRTR
jgi:hypothetical protein